MVTENLNAQSSGAVLVCPHCHGEVPHGAKVCRGCQAEIEYGTPPFFILVSFIISIFAGFKISSWVDNGWVGFFSGILVFIFISGFFEIKIFSKRIKFKRVYKT